MLGSPDITDSSPAAFDETEQLLQGVFEPPSSLILSAISRNKLLVLAVAIVCAAIGVLIGAKRPITYTASATLQVGQVNPNSPGFFGYVQSSASLATAFSRSIAAEPVLAAVHHKLKLAPSQAAARLSAAPIPEAPAFRVIATGPTEPTATALANVAASAVIAYVSQSNSTNPEAASLLKEYRDESIHLQNEIKRYQRLFQAKSTPPGALAQTQAERNAAAVKLRAIGAAYTSAVTSQAPRNGLITLLAGATSATNNRSSKIELFGFIGLLAGIIAGTLTATLRERLRT